MRPVALILLIAGAVLLVTEYDVEFRFGPEPSAAEREVERLRETFPSGTEIRLLRSFRSPGGDFVFATAEMPEAGERPVPEITYTVPSGRGGGTRLVAVGDGRRGGWALDVWVLREPGADVVYGATIPQAARVRYPLKGGGRGLVPVMPVHGNDRYRYVVARLPPGSVADDPPAAFAALDARGRLLGRVHRNDGNDGFGAMDGSYDRASARRRAP